MYEKAADSQVIRRLFRLDECARLRAAHSGRGCIWLRACGCAWLRAAHSGRSAFGYAPVVVRGYAPVVVRGYAPVVVRGYALRTETSFVIAPSSS